jgi:hypothetical protein
MKKTITYTATLISALLFSGAAAAVTPDQETDILYGNGTVQSVGEQDNADDLIYQSS